MFGTGADIVLSVPPKGVFKEGTISGALKPGTQLTIQPGTAPKNGEFTWEAYETSSGADGDPRLVAVLMPDPFQGKSALDAYVSGTRCFIYCPLPGEELNMLLAGQAGTGSANAFTIGERLMPQHATGKLIAQSSSSGPATFQCLEHIDEIPNTDTLAWCMRS